MKFQHILHLPPFFCIKFLIFTFPNTLKVFPSHFGGVSEFFFRATLASAHFVRCQNFPEFFLLHLQQLGNASVLWCSNQPSLRLMGKIAVFTFVLLPRRVFSCNRAWILTGGEIPARRLPEILFDPLHTWPYLKPLSKGMQGYNGKKCLFHFHTYFNWASEATQ